MEVKMSQNGKTGWINLILGLIVSKWDSVFGG